MWWRWAVYTIESIQIGRESSDIWERHLGTETIGKF